MWKSYLGAWACVCTHMRERTHTHTHVVGARGEYQLLSCICPHLIFWDSLPLNLKLTELAKAGGQQAPGVLLSLPPNPRITQVLLASCVSSGDLTKVLIPSPENNNKFCLHWNRHCYILSWHIWLLGSSWFMFNSYRWIKSVVLNGNNSLPR